MQRYVEFCQVEHRHVPDGYGYFARCWEYVSTPLKRKRGNPRGLEPQLVVIDCLPPVLSSYIQWEVYFEESVEVGEVQIKVDVGTNGSEDTYISVPLKRVHKCLSFQSHKCTARTNTDTRKNTLKMQIGVVSHVLKRTSYIATPQISLHERFHIWSVLIATKDTSYHAFDEEVLKVLSFLSFFSSSHDYMAYICKVCEQDMSIAEIRSRILADAQNLMQGNVIQYITKLLSGHVLFKPKCIYHCSLQQLCDKYIFRDILWADLRAILGIADQYCLMQNNEDEHTIEDFPRNFMGYDMRVICGKFRACSNETCSSAFSTTSITYLSQLFDTFSYDNTTRRLEEISAVQASIESLKPNGKPLFIASKLYRDSLMSTSGLGSFITYAEHVHFSLYDTFFVYKRTNHLHNHKIVLHYGNVSALTELLKPFYSYRRALYHLEMHEVHLLTLDEIRVVFKRVHEICVTFERSFPHVTFGGMPGKCARGNRSNWCAALLYYAYKHGHVTIQRNGAEFTPAVIQEWSEYHELHFKKDHVLETSIETPHQNNAMHERAFFNAGDMVGIVSQDTNLVCDMGKIKSLKKDPTTGRTRACISLGKFVAKPDLVVDIAHLMRLKVWPISILSRYHNMIKSQHGKKPLRQIRLVGCGDAAYAGATFDNTIRKLVDMVSNDIFVEADVAVRARDVLLHMERSDEEILRAENIECESSFQRMLDMDPCMRMFIKGWV